MKEEEQIDLAPGDIVLIDMEDPAWEHLSEKDEHHPLRRQGVVTEVRERSYVVKFDKWVAYLKQGDLIKISE